MAFWNDPSSLLPKQSHRWVVSFGDNEDETSEGKEWKQELIPQYFAKSLDKPSFKIETVQAKYLYRHTFNFPKNLVWNPIKIEFYDVMFAKSSEKDGIVSKYKFEPIVNPKSGGGIVDNNKKMLGAKYNKSTNLFFQTLLQLSGYIVPNEYELEDKLLRFRTYTFKNTMNRLLAGQAADNLKYNVGNQNYPNNFICIKELNPDGYVIEKWKLFNPLITSLTTGRLDYSTDNILTVTVDLSYDWAQYEPNKI